MLDKKPLFIVFGILALSAVITYFIIQYQNDESALIKGILENVANEKYAEAEVQAKKLIAMSREKIYPTTLLGAIYATQNKYALADEVMANLVKSCESDEERGLAYGYWAMIYVDQLAGFNLQKNPEKFCKIANDALEVVKCNEMYEAIADIAPSAILFGDKLPSKEEVAMVEKLLQKCLSKMPNSALIYHSLSLLYSDGLIDNKKSIEYLEKAVKIEPESRLYRFSLGLLLYFDGQGAKAVDELKKSLALKNPDDDQIDDAEILLNLAMASIVNHKPDDALSFCDQAKKWYINEGLEQNPVIDSIIGACTAMKNGNKAEAEGNILLIADNYSDVPEIRQEIISLMRKGLGLE